MKLNLKTFLILGIIWPLTAGFIPIQAFEGPSNQASDSQTFEGDGDDYVAPTPFGNQSLQNQEPNLPQRVRPPLSFLSSAGPIQNAQQQNQGKGLLGVTSVAHGLLKMAIPVLQNLTNGLLNRLDNLVDKMKDRSNKHKEKLKKYIGLFEKFKKVFKKKFKSDFSEARGLENFESNNDFCDEKNSKQNNPYQLGLNEWSYLSFDEFSDRFLMKDTEKFKDDKYLLEKLKENPSKATFFKARNPNFGSSPWGSRRLLQTFNAAQYAQSLGIPTSKSWKQFLTPVKSQGKCNSCYAFAGVGCIETLIGIRTSQQKILSEKEIIDCSYFDNGCTGGDPFNVYLYYSYYGLAYNASYPYFPNVTNCNYLPESNKHFMQVNMRYLGGDPASLLQALATGPVAVIHEVDREFSLYKTGVYTKEKCGVSLNHSAVAFGYNLDAPIPYIEVKNAWKSTWGDGGFYKLALGPLDGTSSRGTCGLFSHDYNSQVY